MSMLEPILGVGGVRGWEGQANQNQILVNLIKILVTSLRVVTLRRQRQAGL